MEAEEYGEAVLSVVDEANSGNVEKWKDEDMASLLYKTRQEGRQAGNLEARRQMALQMLKANKLSGSDNSKEMGQAGLWNP